MLACPQDLFFKTDQNTDFNDKRPRHKMNGLQQQMDHVSNKEKEEVSASLPFFFFIFIFV